MKAQATRRRRRAPNPFGRLDLRIEVTQDDILSDLHYPAPAPRTRRRP
jgi:hypothetical protein